jgi:hypothetical protein
MVGPISSLRFMTVKRSDRGCWLASLDTPGCVPKISDEPNQTLQNESASARNSFNFATRYSFASGRLKGLRVGASGFRQPGEVVEIANRPALQVAGFTMLNAFGGYERRLTKGVLWALQLNADNVLGLHTRVGRNYFGTSFLPPTKLSVTNTFKF